MKTFDERGGAATYHAQAVLDEDDDAVHRFSHLGAVETCIRSRTSVERTPMEPIIRVMC